MEKQALVRKGYERLASAYNSQRHIYPSRKLLERFVRAVATKKKGKILDLGCGAGVPVARFLVRHGYSFTGIDISQNMLRLARKIHVPRIKHATIYRRLRRILKPGGILLAASGTNSDEYYGEFMGERMFWSHYAPKKTLAILQREGFEILWSKILKLGGERQFWIRARNKAD